MSYNHTSSTYNSRNTGENFMRNNFHYVNTARASSPNSKISFSGSSGSKKWLIGALVLVVFLLLAAVVVIILFATGVFDSEAVPQTQIFTQAPIVDRFVNKTYTCQVFILKQANDYYDDPMSFYTIQAKRMATQALVTVMSRTPIAPMGLRTELVNMQNSGNDVAMTFRLRLRVPASSDLTAIVIRNTVLTPRTLNDLGAAMNNVAIDTSPNRVLVADG
ncbi:unnamed protein product, partial [Mesorhabditis belari]|uniref:SEA domain-containing protein n=1 Tax=Mesorhabditis belari TaxID=2138241 RepID=A0AAF3F617_9BILA